MPKGSELFLVDSSGWIEFLGDGPLADRFAPYFEREERLIVPAIVLSEVYKKLLSERGSTAADRFLSAALRACVVPIDELRNRSSCRGATHHIRRAFSRLARSNSLLSRATSVFLTKEHPA
jgi:predicted nucleic acid-binding protein